MPVSPRRASCRRSRAAEEGGADGRAGASSETVYTEAYHSPRPGRTSIVAPSAGATTKRVSVVPHAASPRRKSTWGATDRFEGYAKTWTHDVLRGLEAERSLLPADSSLIATSDAADAHTADAAAAAARARGVGAVERTYMPGSPRRSSFVSPSMLGASPSGLLARPAQSGPPQRHACFEPAGALSAPPTAAHRTAARDGSTPSPPRKRASWDDAGMAPQSIPSARIAKRSQSVSPRHASHISPRHVRPDATPEPSQCEVSDVVPAILRVPSTFRVTTRDARGIGCELEPGAP